MTKPALEESKERGIELPARFRFYGGVSALYAFNLVDPAFKQGANFLRLNDADHDTVTVPYARLGVVRRVSGLDEFDAGLKLELAAGRMIEAAFPDDTLGNDGITLSQAYVQLQLPTPLNPLVVTAGRKYAWFGIESLDPADNPNVSLSHLVQFTPNTVTGVSFGMELAHGLRYEQWIVQGADRVTDNNDSKSFGGRLSLELEDATVAFNWIAGAEADLANAGDRKWQVELAVHLRPTSSLDLRFAAHYGQEQGGALDGGLGRFGGVFAIAEKSFVPVEGADYHRFALALRAGYWRDLHGATTGLDQHLGEVTATFRVRFIEHAGLRVEYRRDMSNRSDAFLGHRGGFTRRHQDTLAVDLYFKF